MEEYKFALDIIAANYERLCGFATQAYGKISEEFRLKLKTAYGDYVVNVYERYSKSKTFFIVDQAVGFYDYYVPIGLNSRKALIDEPSLENCLSASRRMSILGSGGCGKTVLMKHLFLDCPRDGSYIPVFVELRDFNDCTEDLNALVFNALEINGFKELNEFVDKAKGLGHFVFFFDGLDEVDAKLRGKLIKQIERFEAKHKSCPVIVSSRPDATFKSQDSFDVWNVSPLGLDKAVMLIQKLPYQEDVKDKFCLSLKEGLFKSHESFLSNPLLLSIMLLTYGENAQIPNKISIFYEQAYEALFHRHDARKGGFTRRKLTGLDVWDFKKVFSFFSLQSYEKRLFRMSETDCLKFIHKAKNSTGLEFVPRDYLDDLLSSVCLLVEDGLELAYSHRSFQEYFVAVFISNAQPAQQKKLINRYWKYVDIDGVISILLEIDADLVERELFIPKVERFLKEIDVRNKAGITHAAKYVKSTYSEINIDEGDLSAIFEDNDTSLISTVRMAVSHCGTFEFPSKEELGRFRKLLKKYVGDGDAPAEYKTKNLSYKSPIMIDVLNGPGFFSIKFIQSVIDAHKKMKKKHDNSEQDLNALLN